jgi:hypothetical protein
MGQLMNDAQITQIQNRDRFLFVIRHLSFVVRLALHLGVLA